LKKSTHDWLLRKLDTRHMHDLLASLFLLNILDYSHDITL